MNITKEAVLANLELVKQYIAEAEQAKKEETVTGIAIKNRWTGSIIFQSTKTTYKDAVVEALRSDANLHGANLHGANLHGANLHGANLHGANLRDANLHGADLCGANLHGADLCGANLHGANLRDANLLDANLRGADLRGAELMNAKFFGQGGTKELTRAQLPSFLGALGFVIVD